MFGWFHNNNKDDNDHHPSNNHNEQKKKKNTSFELYQSEDGINPMNSFEIIFDDTDREAPPSPMTDVTSSGYWHSRHGNRSKDKYDEPYQTSVVSKLTTSIRGTANNDDNNNNNNDDHHDENVAHGQQEQGRHPNDSGGIVKKKLKMKLPRFKAIRNDFHLCFSSYKEDWQCLAAAPPKADDENNTNAPNKPFSSMIRIVNSMVSMILVQLITTIVVAEMLEKETLGTMGYTEALLSTAISCTIYGLVSGQPIVVMSVSTPCIVLLGTVHTMAQRMKCEYHPFLFWVSVWTSLFLIGTAMFGLTSLFASSQLSLFLLQIFEFYIAIDYMYEAIMRLIEPIHLLSSSNDDTTTSATENSNNTMPYISLLLGMFAFYIAWSLHFAESWVYFTKPIRIFLSSYNLLIAIGLVSAINYLFPGLMVDNTTSDSGSDDDERSTRNSSSSGNHEELQQPSQYNNSISTDWDPTMHRSWIIQQPLSGMTIQGIFSAMIPALMFFSMYLVQHNATSILVVQRQLQEQQVTTNHKKSNSNNNHTNTTTMKKEMTYDWNFVVIGFIVLIPCALLGLPLPIGTIPQSLFHSRAVVQKEYTFNPNNGIRHEHCTTTGTHSRMGLHRQRWSGLGMSLLLLVTFVSNGTILSFIPRGCIYGLYFYLGYVTLHSTIIWERIRLSCMVSENRIQQQNNSTSTSLLIHNNVKWTSVQIYTTIQMIVVVFLLCIVKGTDYGSIFSLFLLFFVVPFRSTIIPRLFHKNELNLLEETIPTNDSMDTMVKSNPNQQHQLPQQQQQVDDRNSPTQQYDDEDYDDDDDMELASTGNNKNNKSTPTRFIGRRNNNNNDLEFLKHPYHRTTNRLEPPLFQNKKTKSKGITLLDTPRQYTNNPSNSLSLPTLLLSSSSPAAGNNGKGGVGEGRRVVGNTTSLLLATGFVNDSYTLGGSSTSDSSVSEHTHSSFFTAKD